MKLLVGALALSFAGMAYAAERPNIILILADDLGYSDLGFQGSEDVLSPNLDKLAESGVRFTDGYVTASVCSPSRAGMISGRYQQQFGHEPNCPPNGKGMDPEVQTIADALKPLGYRSGLIGKWHLGNAKEHYPTNRGFDYFCGLREGSRSYFYDAKKNDRPGDPHGIEINGKQVKFNGYVTDYFTDKALEFIDAGKASEPFFLFLSYTAPHTPMQATKKDLARFSHIKNNKRRTYAAMVWAMDRGIGQVMERLVEKGIRDDTFIIFLSDNGGPAGNGSDNLPLNGHKGIKFEGGIRVPFVMSWPGNVPASQDYDPMVSALDLFPTILTAAGGKPDYGVVEGRDLIPFVNGTADGTPHQKLYWHKEWFSAARDGDWKLMYVQDFGYALYNLKDDVGEKNNVAKQHPEIVEKMRKDLKMWKAKGTGSDWTEGPKWYRVNRQKHIDLIAPGSEISAK